MPNFKCSNCSTIFQTEKDMKEESVLKCPSCSFLIKRKIVDVLLNIENKKDILIRRKCENCNAIYFTDEEQLVRICTVCSKANRPFAVVHKPKQLTKFEFKKYNYNKNIENTIKNVKDYLDYTISACQTLNFDKEELAEFSDFVIKVITNMNIKKAENLKNFTGE